jgi:hypothetical protein
MAAITLRQVKGTPLSIVEVDNNFINLNTDITTFSTTVTSLTNGSFAGTITAQDFNALSDESLKENVSEIVNPISVINSLSGVSFTWKESGESAYGFIAQEVEKVLPEIVSTSDEGIKSVKYLQLIAFLLEAIKDQEVRLTKIESKL